MAIRINRYLSESGFCSRREADVYIAENVVTVNDIPAQFNTKVSQGDIVKIDNERITPVRVVNFNPIPTNHKTVKEVDKPKVDKLPKWLIELRKKHGNFVEEVKDKREFTPKKAKKVKPKTGSKRHTPKKNFN